MSEETTVYTDMAVTVTNTRVVMGGKTYSLANITSVVGVEIPANRSPGIWIAIAALPIALCAGFVANDLNVVLLLGGLVLAVGIGIAVVAKPSYALRLGSASGEVDALASQNREYIMNIVNAVNEAIVRRG